MLCFIDTETGGLDPRVHDLLSVGLVVVDHLGIRDAKEFKVVGHTVDPSAMEVNGIDLNEHNRFALSPGQARYQIQKFLSNYGDLFDSQGRPLVALAGWNVSFDRDFLRQLWKGCPHDFPRIFHHRLFDIQSVVQFHERAGRHSGIVSLDHALALYQIKLKGQRHTALADALATAELYLAMRRVEHERLALEF